MHTSRPGDAATSDDPWGFGPSYIKVVELRAETDEAMEDWPADVPEAPRTSVRPWAPSPAAAEPVAPMRPPVPADVAQRWADAGPLDPAGDGARITPDAASDRIGDIPLHPEPTAVMQDPAVNPRRHPRHLSTVGVVLGALAFSGAAGYLWISSGVGSGRTAAPPLATYVLSSQPPGAQVVVDGVPSGVTPLALRLTPGAHEIVVTTANGNSERRSTTVAAGESVSRHLMLESVQSGPAAGAEPGGQNARAPAVVPPASTGAATVPVVAPPAAGFVTFTVPFDVQIYEGGELLASPGERMRVRPGTHTFTLVNEQLGFRSDETVVVRAGRSTRRVIEARSASLSVNALPWAEVEIAGRSFGETPLANISLPIGAYQVTLRHPTLGEREVAVVVRLGRPNRLAVDLRRQ